MPLKTFAQTLADHLPSKRMQDYLQGPKVRQNLPEWLGPAKRIEGVGRI